MVDVSFYLLLLDIDPSGEDLIRDYKDFKYRCQCTVLIAVADRYCLLKYFREAIDKKVVDPTGLL